MNVILSIGSNYRATQNIMEAEGRLMPLFSFLDVSIDMESPAIDMPEGTPPFTNELVIGNTDLTYEELYAVAKEIEASMTPRTATRIPIDIDILEYDGQRYHPADWQRSYVKELLQTINPTP